MPTYLKRASDPDRLTVTIGKIKDKGEFNDTLTRVKSIPGRRWNPDDKTWDFPADPETALRISMTVEPVMDAAIQAMIREHQAETAESLVTAIGDDAALQSGEFNHLMFPYQRAFVDWSMYHPHVILGDEMGVGKTVQSIGAWQEAKERFKAGLPGPYGTDPNNTEWQDPLLVICPNGLRKNWRNALLHGPRDRNGEQLYDFWPKLTCQILDGQNVGKRRQQLASNVDAFIVNWEKLRSDADILGRRKWSAIIADEAHRAKNHEAQQTKGLFKLHAPLLIAATGTPMMNHPGELWSLLRWLRPEQYRKNDPGGGYWPFYFSYVDDYHTKHGRQIRGIKNADQLRFELADKFVRRTKKHVLPDLPDKLPPEYVDVEFKPAERKLYEEAESALFLAIREWAEAQDEDAEELIAELEDMPLDRLERVIPNGAARIQALRQITAMAKAREAVEKVTDNIGTPLVVFTWYVDPAKWIQAQLEKQGLRVGVIAGAADSTAIADEFQSGTLDVVVCTIAKAQGFDLYRASTALFADQDWVPSINDQALDRLHREGQKNAVSSIVYQVPGTVDDGKVAPANRFKRSLWTAVFGDG